MDGVTKLAIAWLLMNWWAHDGLHQHVGMNLHGLLWIEYGFHFTLIISAVVVARYFLTVNRGLAPAWREPATILQWMP
jgi:hypothetical protein